MTGMYSIPYREEIARYVSRYVVFELTEVPVP